jgi:hypothetical protein
MRSWRAWERHSSPPRSRPGSPCVVGSVQPPALLIVDLGAPFRIRAGTEIAAADYADGVVITTPTRAFAFGYPPGTRSVGVHFNP